MGEIHNFFSHSSLRNTSLECKEFENNEPHLHVLLMVPTRWLSLYKCVGNLRKILRSVISVMKEDVIKHRLNDKKKLQKLIDNICNYKFLGFTHFLYDILTLVNHFSCQCQTENFDLLEFYDSYESCMEEIKASYITSLKYGDCYCNFIEETEIGVYLPELLIKPSIEIQKETSELVKSFAKELYEIWKKG